MNAAFPLEPVESATSATNDELVANKRRLARRYVQKLQAIARELYDGELYREASDLLRYLTVVEPGNPSHWYWLGRSFFTLGDPMNAARVFELGGRISHMGQFRRLAAEAWQRAGYPDRAQALLVLGGDEE
jgi:hypothetical protein